MTEMFGNIIIVIGTFLFILFVIELTTGRTKSEKYRSLMTDLYVTGKIKQIAKEDGIDLKEELKDFLQSHKEMLKYQVPLDTSIEIELQERIHKDRVSKVEDKSKK